MRVVMAAKVYLALTGVVVLFQVALVAGTPWGELTMGGAFPGQLPARMRFAAAGSAGLIILFGAIVAARAGLALMRWRRAASWLIWLVVAYSVIGVVLNAVTPSPSERALWLPVTAVLAACALVVACAGAHRHPGG
jgi:hypothetical protein